MGNNNMNIVSLFKDSGTAQKLAEKIKAYKGKPVKIMEVCGTHTMAISRYGIRNILPENIRLISGPGCPVCVTPDFFIKAAIRLSQRDDIIIASFGDMMKIPAGGTSLLQEKAKGRSIKVVYSPLDCVDLAADNPDKKVVFLAVGFETTVPVVAISLLEAFRRGVKNYMLLSANKTIPQAMRILSSDAEIGVDGYIYPGHVSTIIGDGLYKEIAESYNIPGIISGFEPLDLLGAICRLLEIIESGEAKVENLYSRVVKSEGNTVALEKMRQVFEECDSVWRGIGLIPSSGLRLRKEYRDFDAWELLGGQKEELGSEPLGCRCGDILKGKCLPPECPHFGRTCTPETPVGSCMVSSEGTCAAYYIFK